MGSGAGAAAVRPWLPQALRRCLAHEEGSPPFFSPPPSPPLPPLIHDAVDAVVGADIPHAADAAHVADAADVDYAADTTWMTPGGSPAANVLMRSPGPDLFLWLVSKDLIRVALSVTRN